LKEYNSTEFRPGVCVGSQTIVTKKVFQWLSATIVGYHTTVVLFLVYKSGHFFCRSMRFFKE